MYVSADMHLHMLHVEVRGQLAGVTSLFLSWVPGIELK